MGTGLTRLPCSTGSSLIHVIELPDFNALRNKMEECGWLKLRAQLSRKMKAGPRGPCFSFLYFITTAWRACTEVKHASSAALWASACRFTARCSNRWDPAAGSDAGPSSCGEAPPLFRLLPLHCWFSLRPGSPSKSFSSDALIKGFGISALLFVPSPRAWAPPTGGQTTIKEEREKRLQRANNVNWKPLLLSYLRFFF